MANVLTAVFAVALVIGGTLTLTLVSLSSAGESSLAWDRKVGRTGAAVRTELTLINADLVTTSTDVDISFRNAGQTSLAEFAKWDVLIQYYATSTNQGLAITSLSHTTSTTPANGEWTNRGIYLDADTLKAEVYEPNVLNPGEEAIFRLNITPKIPTSTDNVVTIAATNGVTVAAPFSR